MKSKLRAPSTSQGKSVKHQGMSEKIKSLSAPLLILTVSPLTFLPLCFSNTLPPYLFCDLVGLSPFICPPLLHAFAFFPPPAPLSSPLSAGPKMEWLSRTELIVN